MLSGILTVTQTGSNMTNYTSTLFYPGGQYTLNPKSGVTVVMGVGGQNVPADGYLRGYWTNKYSNTYLNQMWNYLTDRIWITMSATVTIVSTEQVWVASTSTPSECPSGPGGKLTGSVCTIGAGDRTTIVNGVPQTVHSDCWQYTDTYLVSEDTTGTCASLISNPACTKSAETCSEYVGSDCSHKDYTYQCQKVFSSSGLVCGGQYFCQTGDCSDTDGAGDSGFDTAVAKLAGLASAGDDVVNDQINIKAFTGEAMSCRKALPAFQTAARIPAGG